VETPDSDIDWLIGYEAKETSKSSCCSDIIEFVEAVCHRTGSIARAYKFSKIGNHQRHERTSTRAKSKILAQGRSMVAFKQGRIEIKTRLYGIMPYS
jgi:hypothetical protein